MSLLALRALFARVPGIVIVIALVVVSIAAAGFAIYRNGEHAGAQRIVAAAKHDTTVRAIARVDTATTRSDVAVTTARTRRVIADSSYARTHALKLQAAIALDSATPALQQLVTSQDSTIVQGAVALTAAWAAIDSLERERVARQSLDTARVHESTVTPPDSGESIAKRAGKVAVVAVALGAAVRWAIKHVVRQ